MVQSFLLAQRYFCLPKTPEKQSMGAGYQQTHGLGSFGITKSSLEGLVLFF